MPDYNVKKKKRIDKAKFRFLFCSKQAHGLCGLHNTRLCLSLKPFIAVIEVCLSFDTFKITWKNHNVDTYGLFLFSLCSLFTFGPRPSSLSVIYRGSPLTPVPSQASVIDDHQHSNTAQYFNFLPKKRNFRGWAKFRGAVWCLQLPTSPGLMLKTWDPNVQLRIFQKPGPLCVNKTPPAAIVLLDSGTEDTDRRPNSLYKCSITQIRAFLIEKCIVSLKG